MDVEYLIRAKTFTRVTNHLGNKQIFAKAIFTQPFILYFSFHYNAPEMLNLNE